MVALLAAHPYDLTIGRREDWLVEAGVVLWWTGMRATPSRRKSPFAVRHMIEVHGIRLTIGMQSVARHLVRRAVYANPPSLHRRRYIQRLRLDRAANTAHLGRGFCDGADILGSVQAKPHRKNGPRLAPQRHVRRMNASLLGTRLINC